MFSSRISSSRSPYAKAAMITMPNSEPMKSIDAIAPIVFISPE